MLSEMLNMGNRLFAVACKLHQVRFFELVNFTVHYAIHVAGLIVGAMVFYTVVVKNVAAYLRTPFDLLLVHLYKGL